MTETVIINDVGPRDGLQNDAADVTPEDRALLINRLIDAGVPAVEVASFVSPRAVPKMAGADRVVAGIDLSRADCSALVPNHKGYELARDAGIRSVAVVLSATDAIGHTNTYRLGTLPAALAITVNLDYSALSVDEGAGTATVAPGAPFPPGSLSLPSSATT